MTIITSILGWMLKTLGLPMCVLIGFYAYEEGIPSASRIAIPAYIPFIGGFGLANIPILGDMTVGHVHTFAADQVRLATAQQTAIFNAKLEKLVSGEQLRAANAQLAETKRQRDAAESAVISLNMRQAADDAFNEQMQIQSDKELSDYEIKLKAAGHACTVDSAGADWLRKH